MLPLIRLMDVEDIRFQLNYYFSSRHVKKTPLVSNDSQYI